MAVARRSIETKTVGKTLAHDSAPLHVQGSATYIDYMREPEGLVHVYPGFAKDGALGKIKTLDLSAVKSAPGVIAVFTAKDIPGLNDCAPVFGDAHERPVTWLSGARVGTLAGQTVRLRFELQDAHLYAYRFAPAAAAPSASQP